MPILLLFLLPTTSYAQIGPHPENLVYFLIGLCIAWVILTLLILLVCLLRCRQWSMWMRLGLPVVFFFSPILLFGLPFLEDYAFGKIPRSKTEITHMPTEVYGVTFPPGSEASYQQEGGFFGWHAKRTLIAIHSPHPVLLGNLSISAFIEIPSFSGNQARVILSEDETINGMPCGNTVVNLTPSGPTLDSCKLLKPIRQGDKLLPAGMTVKFYPVMAEPDKQDENE